MNVVSILYVASGAALGGTLRFIISDRLKSEEGRFPIATCIINILGSFLLGMIISWSLKNSMSSSMKLFLATGFCGGFTTFSTFSLEWLGLIQGGHPMMGFAYVFISLAGGILFAWLGYRMI